MKLSKSLLYFTTLVGIFAPRITLALCNVNASASNDLRNQIMLIVNVLIFLVLLFAIASLVVGITFRVHHKKGNPKMYKIGVDMTAIGAMVTVITIGLYSYGVYFGPC